MNKIILYIATSLDGFIADVQGGVDWLPQPKDEAELEAVGYNNLMSRIDTILMGSRSYEQILGFGDWGWPDKQTYVFTSKALQSDRSFIKITHASPLEFVTSLRERPSGKDIWLLGGSALVKSFAQEDLIDEVVLTIVPQILKTGIPLGLSFEKFNLITEKTLTDGMIQKRMITIR